MKEQILAVQRMQDYIEAHLGEKIGLSELSGAEKISRSPGDRLHIAPHIAHNNPCA